MYVAEVKVLKPTTVVFSATHASDCTKAWTSWFLSVWSLWNGLLFCVSAGVCFSCKKWCHFSSLVKSHSKRYTVKTLYSSAPYLPGTKLYLMCDCKWWETEPYPGREVRVDKVHISSKEKRVYRRWFSVCQVDSHSVSHCVAYEFTDRLARLPWQKDECSEYFLV